MVERTARWLQSLDANETIMVPAIVAAEYLQGFDGDTRPAQYQALRQNYFIPAFDGPCASKAAELMCTDRVVKLQRGGRRSVVKADAQIVATAIVHGADVLVTNDIKAFQTIAAGLVSVSAVPDVATQPDLFPESS